MPLVLLFDPHKMQDLFHYSYYLSFTDYKIKSFL
nr:MAG TPA: hypothetical protein [Caudoviricetes sp.]